MLNLEFLTKYRGKGWTHIDSVSFEDRKSLILMVEECTSEELRSVGFQQRSDGDSFNRFMVTG